MPRLRRFARRWYPRLRLFPRQPQVLSLTPRSLAEVWDDIRRVGDATGHSREAEALAATIEQRVAAIEAVSARAASRPRVLVPRMAPLVFRRRALDSGNGAQKAGGEDVLGRLRQPS